MPTFSPPLKHSHLRHVDSFDALATTGQTCISLPNAMRVETLCVCVFRYGCDYGTRSLEKGYFASSIRLSAGYNYNTPYAIATKLSDSVDPPLSR